MTANRREEGHIAENYLMETKKSNLGSQCESRRRWERTNAENYIIEKKMSDMGRNKRVGGYECNAEVNDRVGGYE